jgi:manganese/zinc/iron transport system substrate-binding protein
MVADLVKNIGGEHVEITTLMGAGVDPHLYNATPADVTALNRADIVFYSGLHLEGKLAELLERMSDRKPTVAVAEVIAEDNIRRDEHGAADPHVWFDVVLWSIAGGAVEDALVKFDPTHAEDYQQNAAKYQIELAVLNVDGRPPDMRSFIRS